MYRETIYNQATVREEQLTRKTSNSLSTLILPLGSKSSDEGTYIRLEGYTLTLVNDRMKNKSSHFYDLGKDLDYMLILEDNKVDILQSLTSGD
jgi:hypothetical protein